MVTRIVKTTIEISDELARKAKAYAARNHLTLRAMIERGLRHVLREQGMQPQFKLRDASVDGQGLQEEFQDADWVDIREATYEGRGS